MTAKSIFAFSIAAVFAAGCATTPPVDDVAYLDERALQSCLGPSIPVELVHDPSRVNGAVMLELYVYPSGKIYYASIVAGSGNAALDDYLARRLSTTGCTPFEGSDSDQPYYVELELSVETLR